jgi:hypothetical protein
MTCQIIGQIAGFIGSIILAFSLGKLFKTYNAVFRILEGSLSSIADVLNSRSRGFVPGNIITFIAKNKKKSDIWTVIGVTFLAIGFAFNLTATLI